MSMKKKKLLIAMPTLSRGGGERVVSELSRVFAEHLDVVIAVFEKKASYPYKGRIIDLGIPLSPRFLDRILLFLKRLWRFKQAVDREKPDTVITLGLSVGLMAVLVVKNPVVRVDMFISVGRKGFLGFVAKLLARFLLKKAGLIVAVSRAIAQDLEEHYGVPRTKLKTIYNPVDVRVARGRAEEGIAKEHQELFFHPVVITMGRLTQQKGQWHLLRAFREVKKEVPKAELVLLGEGELRKRLEQLTRELKIAGSVHFLGWQENPFSYLKTAQLFVLSSLWEGLPDVMPEAMACGLPVAAADCRSGPREILAPSTDPLFQTKSVEEGEYGILLPVCDGKWRKAAEPLTAQERMMAKTIAGLLGDAETLRRFQDKSALRVRDFDIQTIIPQWRFLWGL
ncbi:MAG: hypothetical protein A3D64_01440 [Candidatus Wildermuthbacteria bacterium RIFCSPHIGHO2_02_FULL_49_9]|uniref:Glycosyl transferase family 1 domain-containing protein n=2 Tax=Candidatus Wildermuthiibacteriota TaxID=1817923 RepID=A0A1G2RCT1_9BACT|nr:MAG: hypothetical protein A3D64_01440 [Candidatus Wildermuthbacteria bacterium RIFCSPHIGHO2_02_FULL_49_9]